MAAREIKALLFDLGGVVIDIDFDRALRAWQPISTRSFDELKLAFRLDQHYARQERGEISQAEYFDHLAACLDLQGDQDQIAAGWNAIFVGEIAETVQMIRRARALLPCFAFTNTNPTHQAAWSNKFPAVVGLFDRIFASHELGCRKPEAEAFEFIARAIEVPLQSILFFDDLAENVEGATSVGMRAVRVGSPGDVRLTCWNLA